VAAGRIEGQVQADGSPVANSTVTLWAATADEFVGGGLPGPWAATIDGNDDVWISNFAMPNSPIVQLCGARTENCPPSMKTGEQISPPGGYVGGGLQMQTDLAIDPAGNIWVIDNWEDIDSCFGEHSEALSTRCGGQGVTVFFGRAKPVRAPRTSAPAVVNRSVKLVAHVCLGSLAVIEGSRNVGLPPQADRRSAWPNDKIEN
jgi:hypothetical protein